MLQHGLKQDEFYTWQYRGRSIRLGEIPPLPLDMQKPMPDEEKKIKVKLKIDVKNNRIQIRTNLPDNFQLYGKINGSISFSNIVVKNGVAIIPFNSETTEFKSLDAYSVATVTGVDLSIVGDRCRNLVGKYVKFNPINGNTIEFHTA
jgi:hypothetical protein